MAEVLVGNLVRFHRFSHGVVMAVLTSTPTYPLKASGTYDIGTLPYGYRPIVGINQTFASTQTLNERLFIYNDGRVMYHNYNTSTDGNAYTVVTYVTGDGYPSVQDGLIVSGIAGTDPELKG